MKIYKIVYWIATILLSLMMLASAGFYLFSQTAVAAGFGKLGFPAFLVVPLAIAKILGVIAILAKPSQSLKEWAYAGFFFVFLLAFAGHLNAGDGGFISPVIATILLFVSYFTEKRNDKLT